MSATPGRLLAMGAIFAILSDSCDRFAGSTSNVVTRTYIGMPPFSSRAPAGGKLKDKGRRLVDGDALDHANYLGIKWLTRTMPFAGDEKMRTRVAMVCLALVVGQPSLTVAEAPKKGGTLTYAVTAEAPTTDCHATTTYAAIHVLAPHYSLLLRVDADNYPKLKPDVAESWSVSPDGLTYTFKVRPNVVFHDGSALTAADVKATFDRLRAPPAGIISIRQALFADIVAIDTPDPATAVMKLKKSDASFLDALALPYNCIYSAERLAQDANYPAKTVMGSGPFVFVEHVNGSHWVGKRFDKYWDSAKRYLDGWQASDALSKITIVKPVGGPLLPGSPFALSAEELASLPGFGRDMEKARAGAKRLLAEAGGQDLKARLINRNVNHPFTRVGVFMVDQFRRIGVMAEHTQLDVSQQKAAIANGDYQVAIDAFCADTDDAGPLLLPYLSKERSPRNMTRSSNPELDAVDDEFKRATDPAARLSLAKEMQRRVIRDANSIPVIWYSRIVAHVSNMNGWKIIPSHFANQDLADIWLE